MTLTIHRKVRFENARKGRKEIVEGDAPATPDGRVPRVARLMAIAIRFQGLLDRGEIRDYADLARLGHVTRARVSQIMNLLNLAPDIQEAVLFLPSTTSGRDDVSERDLRPIAAVQGWVQQRGKWQQVMSSLTSTDGSRGRFETKGR